MARSCLFTLCLPYAVFFKKGFKLQVFRNYAQASFKECRTQAENVLSHLKNKHDIPEKDTEINLEALKRKILKASLPFVPENGWSEKSLAFGAKSLGISLAAHTLIKGGGADLVHYFNFSCNMELEDYMKETSHPDIKIDLQLFLTDALEYRLRMITPYLSQWPEALALISVPSQIPMHTKNVLDLVDSIWHSYGDTSVDMSWYSKRLALAIAYKAAELSLIQDKSLDFSDTLTFLERRVENVLESEKIIHTINDSSKHFMEFGNAAFITVRNLLGLNRWFR